MTAFIIGTVVTADGVLEGHRIDYDATGVITAIVPAPDGKLDDELIILPGLADIHNHGGAGESFPTSGIEGCVTAARHHRAHGSTTLLASTVSMREEVLLPQLSLLSELASDGEITGIHAEGPFVNSCRCGAQDPAAIIGGDPELFAKMIKASRGFLRSMTFAPETPHARKLVDMCAEHNVVVSLGHTDADFELTMDMIRYAEQRGAVVTATHLFNAMPPIHHRAPGPAAAFISAAARSLAHVELIADGVHLNDHTVSMVLDSVGSENVTFVSDAMGAAGKADGDYILGALAVTVIDGVARLSTEDGSQGAIAGGTSRVIDQVRRQVAAGHSVVDVVRASTSGHRLLGLNDRGDIAVGKKANFVVCRNDFDVVAVYENGQKLDF